MSAKQKELYDLIMHIDEKKLPKIIQIITILSENDEVTPDQDEVEAIKLLEKSIEKNDLVENHSEIWS